MKSATKNTIKSVIVLSVVSVVCVALLAVGNAFIPKYKPTLDLKTTELLNEICPSGVDDRTAFDEGYFALAEADEDSLAAFNKASRAEANNSVLAVYKAVKGENTGMLIVEAQAQGWSGNDPIILLTAIDESGAVFALTVKQQRENSPGSESIFTEENLEELKAYVKGKTQITASDIKASTGATSAYSIGGVINAVDISLKAAEGIKNGELKVTFGEESNG